jgi:hypothetical protein
MKFAAWMIGLCLSAVLCLWICVNVEALNTVAGNILPRELPEQGNPKWRVLALPAKQLPERYARTYRYEHGLAVDAILPSVAQAEIRSRVQIELPRHQAENKLRALVGSWGLLQYPIGLILLVAGSLGAGRCKRPAAKVVHGVVGVVGGIGLAMAFHRAYYSSLGW